MSNLYDLTPRAVYEQQLSDAAATAGYTLLNYTTLQSVDTLANYSYWKASNASAYPTITYSFPVIDPSNIPAAIAADYVDQTSLTNLYSFSAAQAEAARLAVELWDDLIPIDFVDAGTDPTADTRFCNSALDGTAGGAPAGTGRAGDIWIYNYLSSPPPHHAIGQ